MASEKRHNGGGTGPFTFDFPSLDQSDIKVSVGNTEVTSGFSINNYDPTTGGDITFTSNTTSGTNNVRIYRQTEPEKLAATFVAGSSISANDLNNCNKQTIFLADENRTSINNLALGDSGSAIVISGTNIADNSISSTKILDLEVKTADINNLAVTTGKIADDAVTADKLANSINSAIAANTAKVTNATHTGDVTGSTALTIADGAVTQAKLNSALLTALQTNFSNPVGTVIWFAGTKPPVGYLKCDGRAINNGNTTFTDQDINNATIGTIDTSALYAIVSANVPDLRGEFIRGWDDGKGVDSGRGMRTGQLDSVQDHQHEFGADDQVASQGGYTNVGTFSYDATSNTSGGGQRLRTKNQTGRTAAETRPRNVSLLACIKY